MASFVIQHCRLLADRIVPTRDPPVSCSWEDLCTRFSTSKTDQSRAILKGVQQGAFVGLIRSKETKEIVNFLLVNPNRTGRIDWLLKRDASVADRLVDIYQVEAVIWDANVEELPSTMAV